MVKGFSSILNSSRVIFVVLMFALLCSRDGMVVMSSTRMNTGEWRCCSSFECKFCDAGHGHSCHGIAACTAMLVDTLATLLNSSTSVLIVPLSVH